MTDPSPTALTHLAAEAVDAGLLLDFDGVLSPIIDRAGDARILPGNAELLERIARRLRAVAVLSGRPTAFLRDRVRANGISLIGSYGLEDAPEAQSWLPQIALATDSLQQIFAGAVGVLVETKPVGVSVHWRMAPDRAWAEADITTAVTRIAADTGLEPVGGKLVLELRPPLAVDKGTALRAFAARHDLRLVVYAGDDEADEPALRAVREIGGYALLVHHGGETPAAITDLASEVIHGVEGFQVWLRALAGRLELS